MNREQSLDLDGDVASELRVARAVHLAHAAGSEQSGDLVRAEAGTWREGHRFSVQRDDTIAPP